MYHGRRSGAYVLIFVKTIVVLRHVCFSKLCLLDAAKNQDTTFLFAEYALNTSARIEYLEMERIYTSTRNKSPPGNRRR